MCVCVFFFSFLFFFTAMRNFRLIGPFSQVFIDTATSRVYTKITTSWSCIEMEGIINCREIKSDLNPLVASFASVRSFKPKPESFEGFLLKRNKNQPQGYHRGLSEMSVEILAARALFVICTRVTTLHLCYTKNAFLVFSQSATKKKIKETRT